MLRPPRNSPADLSALSAHDRVYRTLRTQVMHGELAPGQALTLRGIARDFGVSMTPAREAVQRLVAEGALSMSASGRVTTPERGSHRRRPAGSECRCRWAAHEATWANRCLRPTRRQHVCRQC